MSLTPTFNYSLKRPLESENNSPFGSPLKKPRFNESPTANKTEKLFLDIRDSSFSSPVKPALSSVPLIERNKASKRKIDFAFDSTLESSEIISNDKTSSLMKRHLLTSSLSKFENFNDSANIDFFKAAKIKSEAQNISFTPVKKKNVPATPTKKPRLDVYPSSLATEKYIPANLRKQKAEKVPSILIYQNYDHPEKGQLLNIPGIDATFSIKTLGTGKNLAKGATRIVYIFQEQGTLELSDKNPYFKHVKPGVIDLSKVVLKVVLPDMDPLSKQLLLTRETTLDLSDSPLRPRTYAYGADGTIIQEKVKRLNEATKEEFDRALQKARDLYDENIAAEKEIYWDIRPDNMGLSFEDGRVVNPDLDASPHDADDFVDDKTKNLELARNLRQWTDYQLADQDAPDQSTRSARWDFLTANFPKHLINELLELLKTMEIEKSKSEFVVNF